MIREKYLQECANSYLAKTYESLDSYDIEFISCIIDAFEAGAKWAYANPKSPWISVDDDLPCNHREYIDLKYNSYTCQMLVRCKNGIYSVERMVMIFGRWIWAESNNITHWMPIPKLEEE